MSDPKVLDFEAEVGQTKNMADNTTRICLELPEQAAKFGAVFLTRRAWRVRVMVEFIEGPEDKATPPEKKKPDGWESEVKDWSL